MASAGRKREGTRGQGAAAPRGETLPGGWTLVRRIPLGVVGELWDARAPVSGFRRTVKVLRAPATRVAGAGAGSGSPSVPPWGADEVVAGDRTLLVAAWRPPSSAYDPVSDRTLAGLRAVTRALLGLHGTGGAVNLLTPEGIGLHPSDPGPAPVFVDHGVDPVGGEGAPGPASPWWAPEQVARIAAGRPPIPSPPSDAWFVALAALSALSRRFVLEGVRPDDREGRRDAIAAAVRGLGLPASDKQVLGDALLLKPSARPTVKDLLALLDRAASAAPVAAPRPAEPAPEKPVAQRPPAPAAPAPRRTASRRPRPEAAEASPTAVRTGRAGATVAWSVALVVLLGGGGWLAWRAGWLGTASATEPTEASRWAEQAAVLAARRDAIAAALPAGLVEAERLGLELREIYDRGWRIAYEEVPALEAMKGWRREAMVDEVARGFCGFVRGRLAVIESRADAAPWPDEDPLGARREAVEALNREIERAEALAPAGASLPFGPLPEWLPGGPGVPRPDDLRALAAHLEAEAEARRRHRTWTSQTRGDPAQDSERILALYARAISLDSTLAEAAWGMADRAVGASLPTAADERRRARDAAARAMPRIEAAALPWAEERLRRLRERAMAEGNP